MVGSSMVPGCMTHKDYKSRAARRATFTASISLAVALPTSSVKRLTNVRSMFVATAQPKSPMRGDRRLFGVILDDR